MVARLRRQARTGSPQPRAASSPARQRLFLPQRTVKPVGTGHTHLDPVENGLGPTPCRPVPAGWRAATALLPLPESAFETAWRRPAWEKLSLGRPFGQGPMPCASIQRTANAELQPGPLRILANGQDRDFAVGSGRAGLRPGGDRWAKLAFIHPGWMKRPPSSCSLRRPPLAAALPDPAESFRAQLHLPWWMR